METPVQVKLAGMAQHMDKIMTGTGQKLLRHSAVPEYINRQLGCAIAVGSRINTRLRCMPLILS
ncbi:MAG: hypothetical protein ACRETO_10090 [Gammaproteobacteria bacterium]